ncbi:hypothetical protein BCR44DRAFT_27800 [Catenaria anguillulae PL171]|uniref:Caspase domain-domain-containing protein n=1 Tax=Catenaria anguillulae PL171 TaxID=765915 RepID=A0A1Y2I858_9FUNG|nr:hypothetical protein BCR44DRAFT_27800 [Catenaria anguillulae PL171]
MPNQAFIVGVTSQNPESGEAMMPVAGPASQAMANIVMDTGIYSDVTRVSDWNGDAITREEILNGLRSMVEQAEPGDNLFFSFTGRGAQAEGQGGDLEEDGMNEVMWAFDGPITDNEIRDILAELPEGVNMTLAFDQEHAGGMADLQLGEGLAANIVSIGATTSDGTIWANEDRTQFVGLLEEVMAENPGLSWNDAVALMNSRVPDEYPQHIVLDASNPELLDKQILTLRDETTPLASDALLDAQAAVDNAQDADAAVDDACDCDC